MPASSSRPAGAPQVLPYLYYADAGAALAFLTDAFGFTELFAFRDGDGNVLHAQVSTGDGVLLLGPGLEGFGTRSVTSDELATSRTFVYVDDVDGHCDQARVAGATILAEPGDQGPNHVYVARDAGGHEWIFARPLEA